eukprot:s5571_g5.t1
MHVAGWSVVSDAAFEQIAFSHSDSVNDWEEETADLLLGVACAEAAELLAGASRLQGSTLITADDVRQAAFLREGEPPSEAEARKRRKAINEQPLPVVDDTEFLMLTQVRLDLATDSAWRIPCQVRSPNQHLASALRAPRLAERSKVLHVTHPIRNFDEVLLLGTDTAPLHL